MGRNSRPVIISAHLFQPAAQELRIERKLITDYFANVDELLAGVSPDNLSLAVAIASMPVRIRGYGHVKEAHLAKVLPQWALLMQRWRHPVDARKAA